MRQTAILRCGLSGWSPSSGKELLSNGTRARAPHPLVTLARYFDSVEINSTFCEMPRPEISRLWLRKVAENPQFVFTASLSRQFTHERQLEPEAVRQFHEGLYPLLNAGKLGALVMHFPWSFRFTRENRDHLLALRRTFHEFPLVAEMRHESWAADEAIGAFIDHKIGFVNIDQPHSVKAMPPTSFLTSAVGYVRLQGRRDARWHMEFEQQKRSERQSYLYSSAELQEWCRRIEEVRRYASQTFVVFGNDTGSRSLLNALQLEAMLGLEKLTPPPSFLRQFPGHLHPAPAAQQGLFHTPAAA